MVSVSYCLCFLRIDFELPFLHVFDNQVYVGLKIFGYLDWASKGGICGGVIGRVNHRCRVEWWACH